MKRQRATYPLLVILVTLLLVVDASGEGDSTAPIRSENEAWSAHFQATVVPQAHRGFDAAYSGRNSLASHEELKTSTTATLFLGARLWNGGGLYLNPELSAGKGLSGVTGVAGFPNGDIARVGKPAPTVSLARLFLRQTIGLGGEKEKLTSEANQLAEEVDISRITVTLGKYSANDVFDDNAYSHDPRTQFMNWALMDNGAWDYPADTRGYTWGGTVEWNEKRWAARYGLFALPTEANGRKFDHNLAHAQAHTLEWEFRYGIQDHPGRLQILGYWNRARMGNYRRTLETPSFGMDIAQSRTYSSKLGFGLNWEQEVVRNVGVFSRLGWNDGRTESWAFTQIDRSASFGISLSGALWHRSRDVFGSAWLLNGLSSAHRDYLAAGGYGFIVGDGALRYAPEQILENYYSFSITPGLAATLDYQFVSNPGYNQDRGPAHIWALRGHLQF